MGIEFTLNSAWLASSPALAEAFETGQIAGGEGFEAIGLLEAGLEETFTRSLAPGEGGVHEEPCTSLTLRAMLGAYKGAMVFGSGRNAAALGKAIGREFRADQRLLEKIRARVVLKPPAIFAEDAGEAVWLAERQSGNKNPSFAELGGGGNVNRNRRNSAGINAAGDAEEINRGAANEQLTLYEREFLDHVYQSIPELEKVLVDLPWTKKAICRLLSQISRNTGADSWESAHVNLSKAIQALQSAGWNPDDQYHLLLTLAEKSRPPQINEIYFYLRKAVDKLKQSGFSLEQQKLLLMLIQSKYQPVARGYATFCYIFPAFQAIDWDLEEKCAFLALCIRRGHIRAVPTFVAAMEILAKTGWNRNQIYNFLTRFAETAVRDFLSLETVKQAFYNLQSIPWSVDQKSSFLISLAAGVRSVNTAYLYLHLAVLPLEKTGWSFEQKCHFLILLSRVENIFPAEPVYLMVEDVLKILDDTSWSSRQKYDYAVSLADKSKKGTTRIFRFLKILREYSGDLEADLKRLSRLLDLLTDYNCERFFELLDGHSNVMGPVWARGFSMHLDLYVTLFERWPKLGFVVVEGIIEAFEKGIIRDLTPEVRSKILDFVEKTNGFVPVIFAAYLKEGDGVIEKIRTYTDRILKDELSLEETEAIVKENKAYGGIDFFLTVIQGVSPTSGASFVRREEQTGLLRKMMEAGDLRGHIPSAWRGKVKAFELGKGEWSPRAGETVDADGHIRDLLGRFRTGEEKKPKEENLVNALKEYLASLRQGSDKEKFRDVLYACAGSQDALREKIDRIQSVDYSALELLDQLFRDKDNLSVMLRNALKKVPMELLAGKGKREVKRKLEGDAGGLVKQLKQTWKNFSIPEAKRLVILAKMLEIYEASEIQNKILERADVKETPLAEAIAVVLKEGPALSEQEIVAGLLYEPLQMIEQAKAKFEYKAGKPIQVGVRAVKGPAYGIYGLSAGVCTATDIELWKKKEFKLFAIVNEEAKQVVGYVHVFESKDKAGNKILTLPGINPSAEFMGFVDAQKFYDGLMEQIIAYAKEDGFASVYIPTNANIHSNRSGIQKAIQGKGYKPVKIQKVDWNTLPQPYPFEEVFEVWLKP